MFDLNRTIKLIAGALFDREPTWRSYLPEADDWKKTAFLLTGPLIVVSAVASYLLSLVFADSALFPLLQPTLLSTFFTVVTGAITAGVVAFVFSALAGVFGGKGNFALGLAATSLAFVPGYLGQALAWLPWIGGLLAIGLAIFALVQLWKIIPIYLAVPDGKRTLHYIVSVIATIIVMVIIGRIVNPIIYGPDLNSPFGTASRIDSSDGSSGGLFSDLANQASIIVEAEKDTYSPPADGKMTERQIQEYVSTMRIVAEKRKEIMERLQKNAERMDEAGEIIAGDLGNVMTGITGIGSIGTVEIETVRGAHGNWAEHKWIRDSLMEAQMRKSGSDVIEHNYRLYQEYADQLMPAMNQ